MNEYYARKRTQNWTEDETFILISLWKEYIHELRAAKRNRKVYAKIVERLRAMSISKTIESVRSKLQNLTTGYRKERLQMDNGGDTSRWKFWDAVQEVIDHGVVNIDCRNVDSSPSASHEEDVHTSAASRLLMSLGRTARDRDNDDCSDGDYKPFDNETRPSEFQNGTAVHVRNFEDTTDDMISTHTETSYDSSGRPPPPKMRRRRKDIAELLLEQTKRSNDILESMERAAMDVLKESIEGQKQSLELLSRCICLQEALVNAFLKSQNIGNIPPVNQPKE